MNDTFAKMNEYHKTVELPYLIIIIKMGDCLFYPIVGMEL